MSKFIKTDDSPEFGLDAFGNWALRRGSVLAGIVTGSADADGNLVLQVGTASLTITAGGAVVTGPSTLAYTNENAVDAVAAALAAGTHTGITVDYDDANNKISLTVTAVGGGGGTSSPTDLAVGTRNTTTLQVTSSTGNDVTLPAATTTLAGLMPAASVNDIETLKTAVAAAGATRVSRKASVAYNGKTLTVLMVGMGTQAVLDAATVTASTDANTNIVVTISGLGTVKLSTVSVDVPTTTLGGTGLIVVAPDPSGATSLADSNLAMMVVYNDSGAVQAATGVTLSVAGGNLSVQKSGLTANNAYRFKVVY